MYLSALELLCETRLFASFWPHYSLTPIKTLLLKTLTSFLADDYEVETCLIILSYVDVGVGGSSMVRRKEIERIAVSTQDVGVVEGCLRFKLPVKVLEKVFTLNIQNPQIRLTILSTWSYTWNLPVSYLLRNWDVDIVVALPIVCKISATQEGRIRLSSYDDFFPSVLPTLPSSTIRLYASQPGFGLIMHFKKDGCSECESCFPSPRCCENGARKIYV